MNFPGNRIENLLNSLAWKFGRVPSEISAILMKFCLCLCSCALLLHGVGVIQVDPQTLFYQFVPALPFLLLFPQISLYVKKDAQLLFNLLYIGIGLDLFIVNIPPEDPLGDNLVISAFYHGALFLSFLKVAQAAARDDRNVIERGAMPSFRPGYLFTVFCLAIFMAAYFFISIQWRKDEIASWGPFFLFGMSHITLALAAITRACIPRPPAKSRGKQAQTDRSTVTV